MRCKGRQTAGIGTPPTLDHIISYALRDKEMGNTSGGQLTEFRQGVSLVGVSQKATSVSGVG